MTRSAALFCGGFAAPRVRQSRQASEFSPPRAFRCWLTPVTPHIYTMEQDYAIGYSWQGFDNCFHLGALILMS